MNLTPETAPTPIIRQYLALREGLDENYLLLMRVGDFYEAFCDDAVTAAPLLGLALTRRAGVPMCGVPYHAIDAYLAKAIRAGKKVALAEHAYGTENGIGHREISRVITPGPVNTGKYGVGFDDGTERRFETAREFKRWLRDWIARNPVEEADWCYTALANLERKIPFTQVY